MDSNYFYYLLCAGSAILLGLLMTSSVFVEPLFIAFVASKAINELDEYIDQQIGEN